MLWKKFDLWSRVAMDGDGGGDGGGDDVGMDEGFEAFSGAEMEAASGFGDTSTATGGAGIESDPALGFGVPGVDPQATTTTDTGGATAISPEFAAPTDPVTPGISAPTAAQDVSLGSQAPAAGTTGFATPEGPSISERAVTSFKQMSPFANPNPTTVGLGLLSLVNPGFSALALAGKGAGAFGATPGTDVDAYGAPVGEVGTTGARGGGSQGVAGGAANRQTAGFQPFAGGLAAPDGAAETGALPATPAFQRPARFDIPTELAPYLSPGMTNLQLRAAIATNALNNSNPAWRSQAAKNFYDNLITRALVDESGNFNDFSEFLPIEQQYVLQSRGVQAFEPTSQALLESLGTV